MASARSHSRYGITCSLHERWTYLQQIPFPELLAQQVAQLAVEKDFPEGMEPAPSAKQIHYFPSEVENRLPDFCVDGNDCWLVGSQQTQEELLCVPSSEDSACSGLHHSIDGLPAWIGKEQECKRFCS